MMNKQLDYESIALEALTWEGTRFKHQGRVKKSDHHQGGVDCIGLIVGVVDTLGLCDEHGMLLASHDRANYSREPNQTQLQEALERFCYPVDSYQVGDILLFTFVKWPQHAGIVTSVDKETALSQRSGASFERQRKEASNIQFIHANASVGKVIISRLDHRWQRYMVGVYRVPIYSLAKES